MFAFLANIIYKYIRWNIHVPMPDITAAYIGVLDREACCLTSQTCQLLLGKPLSSFTLFCSIFNIQCMTVLFEFFSPMSVSPRQ